MAKRPTQAFEMLEEAAKIVADELTRPRQDNEPIDDDFQVQLISGSNSRSIRELSALDVGKLVKIPGIAVSSSTVKAKVELSSLISIDFNFRLLSSPSAVEVVNTQSQTFASSPVWKVMFCHESARPNLQHHETLVLSIRISSSQNFANAEISKM